MDPNELNNPEPSPEKAKEHFEKGNELKNQGDFSSALTEYRRAVVFDPNHQRAQFAIGTLLKSQAGTNPVYKQHAFDALKKAAHLDLTHKEAHDQYIAMGQQLGLLDDLHTEYEALAKANPDNEMIKQCAKNIVTLSMAMMPTNTGSVDTGSKKPIRKMVLLSSFLLLFMGLVMLIIPPFLNRGNKDVVTKDKGANFFYMGILFAGAGIGGFIINSKLK